MSIAIGGGGRTPSRMASRVSSPDRSSAPAAVIIGSCQVTVRDRGSPHSAGVVPAAVASAVIVVLFGGQAGQSAAGRGEHPLDAGGVHGFTAGAADPVG